MKINIKEFWFVILLVLIPYTILLSQDKENTILNDELLKGNLKSLKEKCYKIEKQDTILAYDFFYKFNKLGLLQERKGLEQVSTYIYNYKNQLIQIDVCRTDKKNCIVNDYFYDDKGNLIKHFSKHPKSTAIITSYYDYFVTHYTYDTLNNLIEEKRMSKPIKSKKEVFEGHYKFDYDATGNIIVEKQLKESGSIIRKIENKYTDSTLTETSTWARFEDSNLYYKDYYKYFDNGMVKSKTSIFYEYDSLDKIVQRDTTNFNYQFDKENRLIKEFENSTFLKANEFYNYDKKDNWQKMVENENGNVQLFLRHFDYYQ